MFLPLRKQILLVVIAHVMLGRPVANAEEASTYHFEQTVNSQTIRVEMEIGPFDPKKHKVERVSLSEGYLVDGQRPIGNQRGSKALSEFKLFVIYWNGKRLLLDRTAWSSIFNVPLSVIQPRSDEPAGLAVVPSMDGLSILFYFRPHSGDGEDPEEAWLIIDKNGNWRKFHSNEVLR